jgi:hypothetical protein
MLKQRGAGTTLARGAHACVLSSQRAVPGGCAAGAVAGRPAGGLEERPRRVLSAASVSGHAAWQRWGAQGIICAGAAQALALARSGGSCGSRVAEGVRAVGSVHRGKIVGNVVEAWERRNVEELQGTRDPANFDDFSVSRPP